MPRYFFDLTDGQRDRDERGTDLRDLLQARAHAIQFAGAVLRAEPELLTTSQRLRVEVRDESRQLLATITALWADTDIAKRSEG